MSASRKAIIDPHLHLFNLVDGNYDWLKSTNPPFWPDKGALNRDFQENDLKLTEPLELVGFVHVEAGFDNLRPWREIDWLQQHCHLPFRSVAFNDLTSNDVEHNIRQLLKRKSVVGIRHILDEDAFKLLSANKTLENLMVLQTHNLSFDLQMSLSDEQGVSALIRSLQQTPELRIIINHSGWPPRSDNSQAWQRWLNNLQHLAEFEHVAIKLSGWEMSNRQWKLKEIEPVIEKVLAVFGENRVMLASNFPLCTWRYSYQNFWENYSLKLNLELNVNNKLCCENAAFWYKLSDELV